MLWRSTRPHGQRQGDACMAYQRRSPPRALRNAEMALLLQLADGPKAVADGPLGRCLKRGWCRLAGPMPNSWKDVGRENGEAPCFELTEAGRAILEQGAAR